MSFQQNIFLCQNKTQFIQHLLVDVRIGLCNLLPWQFSYNYHQCLFNVINVSSIAKNSLFKLYCCWLIPPHHHHHHQLIDSLLVHSFTFRYSHFKCWNRVVGFSKTLKRKSPWVFAVTNRCAKILRQETKCVVDSTADSKWKAGETNDPCHIAKCRLTSISCEINSKFIYHCFFRVVL